MINRSSTKKEIEENKKNQKLRIRVKKAARRSGQTKNTENKVSKSTSKKKVTRSQKRIATVKKRRQ